MRLADCSRCGRGVGRKAETLCCRCRSADRERARRAHCPGCTNLLRLNPETGRCVRCSRTCFTCGAAVRSPMNRSCGACRRRTAAEAAKTLCPGCGRRALIPDDSLLCRICTRPAPARKPARPCSECGALVNRIALGMCGRCWQRHPDRPFQRVHNLRARLDSPPDWLEEFVAYAVARHCVGRTSVMITELGRLLTAEPGDSPQAILESARRPGRSIGALARALEGFFISKGLEQGPSLRARPVSPIGQDAPGSQT